MISITFDGKYKALLYGFRYKNKKQHPKYDWISLLTDEDLSNILQESLNETDIVKSPDQLNEKIGKRLVKRYKQIIVDSPKPKTIRWYNWKELADSTSYEKG